MVTTHTLSELESLRPALGDRRLFPRLALRYYVNHAAVSPVSAPVEQAVASVTRDLAERGLLALREWGPQPGRLKAKLARLVGADSDEIALTTNTSRGLSDFVLCFPWEKSDKIVVFSGEFPANVTPWQQGCSLFELHLVTLPLADADAILETLSRVVRDGVRVVAVSAVQFKTGQRMPLSEMSRICHERDALLCVDGIQACGAVPIDVKKEGVDYLACGAQKWLMGMAGAGFVYCRRELAALLRPAVAGWISHEDPFDFLVEGPGHLNYQKPIKRGIEFIEGGTPNIAGNVALEASLSLLLELSVAQIYEHLQAYNDRLEAGLLERGFVSLRSRKPAERSGILSVDTPPGVSPVALHHLLTERQVCCGLPDGALRFSPHFENPLSEVPEILDILDDVLLGLQRAP